MLCKNHKRYMRGSSPIVTPTCGGNEATRQVTVIYHKNFDGSDNKDVFELCDQCFFRLRGDAEGHGYLVRARLLRGYV